jgi:hypothetical protein
MTSLIAKMAGPKPSPQESDAATNAKRHLTMPRVETGETLAARLLVARQADTEPARGKTDLLLQGLVDRLPKPDASWSLEDRAKWLRTAALVFDLVYKGEDGERREISVGLAKQDA